MSAFRQTNASDLNNNQPNRSLGSTKTSLDLQLFNNKTGQYFYFPPRTSRLKPIVRGHF